jgi:phosphate-selective porin
VTDADVGSDRTWLLWTANLNLTWMGASLAGEYYHLNADPDLGANWDADGYYVQAGYQLIPEKLELGLRYSEIDSTDANASERFDKSELQFGVNYYFVKHNLKLQSDVTLVNDDLTANNDDVIYRLQAQFTY